MTEYNKEELFVGERFVLVPLRIIRTAVHVVRSNYSVKIFSITTARPNHWFYFNRFQSNEEFLTTILGVRLWSTSDINLQKELELYNFLLKKLAYVYGATSAMPQINCTLNFELKSRFFLLENEAHY